MYKVKSLGTYMYSPKESQVGFGLSRSTLHQPPPLKLIKVHVGCSIWSIFSCLFYVTTENIRTQYHSWGVEFGSGPKLCCCWFWGRGNLNWHNCGLSYPRKVIDLSKCLSWATLKVRMVIIQMLSIIRSPEVKRSQNLENTPNLKSGPINNF